MFKNCRWLRVGLTTLAVSALVWGTLLSVAAAARPAPLKYTASPLPAGGYDMNSNGDVVGSALADDGTKHLTLWLAADASQTPVDLDAEIMALPEAEPWEGLTIDYGMPRINDQGQIAGICTLPAVEGVTPQHAFFYDRYAEVPTEARFVVLPNAENLVWGYAYAISNSGLIAGRSVSYGNTQSVAALWDPQNGGTVKTLQDPSDTVDLTSANAVNDSGQVVCNGQLVTTGDTRAVIYAPGAPETYTVLEPLGTNSSTTHTSGNDNNTFGEVVGTTSTASGLRAFAYTTGMVSLGTLKGPSQAIAVNDAGQVVGFYSDKFGGGFYAFLWTPSKGMLDLWGLIANPPAGAVKGDVWVTQIYNPDSDRTLGRILARISNAYYVLTPKQ
jgi:probable HAF family extracellular repeat protein